MNSPITFFVLLLLLLALAMGYHYPCAEYIEGTDMYYECLTGEPIDLTPIQDEADSPTSQGRD